MRVMLPRTRPTATSAADKLDLRDEHIYSSGVFQHGATTSMSLFTVPIGQAIPHRAGSGVAATGEPDHYATYTEQTTNLEKAGELGANIGDAGVRAMGLTFDTATSNAAGTVKTSGATPVEVADILSKVNMEFLVTRKRRIIGPAWMFPQTGGGHYVASTFTSHPGYGQNGGVPKGRQFRVPVMIASNDTVVAKLTPYAALVHSVTATPGQPVLVWCNLIASVGGVVN